jgi:hypothetical protein
MHFKRKVSAYRALPACASLLHLSRV